MNHLMPITYAEFWLAIVVAFLLGCATVRWHQILEWGLRWLGDESDPLENMRWPSPDPDAEVMRFEHLPSPNATEGEGWRVVARPYDHARDGL